MANKTLKLQPNQKYVAVMQESGWVFYPVYNPAGYIHKCTAEGKNAKYIGCSDASGNLNFEE